MCDELTKMMDCLNNNKERLDKLHDVLVNFGVLQEDEKFKFADPHNTATQMCDELTKMMGCLDSNKDKLNTMHNYLATFGLLPKDDNFNFSHHQHTPSEKLHELNKMMDCLNNNKERLDNAHNLLVNSGLLPRDDFKDDFKFADPHTAKEINHELSKIIKGFGQLNTIHHSLNTIFPPKQDDTFQFSVSGKVDEVKEYLTEMQRHSEDFKAFVEDVKKSGVQIDGIKDEIDINNLQGNFDELKRNICYHFHKSDDSSKITTFEDLKKHYNDYVDEKAQAEAAAQAQAQAQAQAAQTAQDNADNGHHRVQIEVEKTLQISPTDGGGIKITTSSNSFVYDKLYELPTKDGFKVYGLSSDGGQEISGLVIMRDNEVLGFESSVASENHRDVNCFIKNEDTNTWISFSYATLGLAPSGIDNSNDDGVLLEQKFAQLLNSAFNLEVASPDQWHCWTPEDRFTAFFGETRLLTIFNQATVPSDCIKGASCSCLGEIMSKS